MSMSNSNHWRASNKLRGQTQKNIPRPFGPRRAWSPGANVADLPSVIGGILTSGPTRTVLPQIFRQRQPPQYPQPYEARIHLEEGDRASHVYFPKDLSIHGQSTIDPELVALPRTLSERRSLRTRGTAPYAGQGIGSGQIVDMIVGRLLSIRGMLRLR